MAERKDLVAQIGANKRRTVYLMAGFAIVITGAVVAFDLVFRFGPAFIVIAFVLALIFVWGSYFYSDKLAISAARAREADPQEFRQLHDIVEELCIGVGLPKPRVYVVDDPAPNAFATGRNPTHSAIAVTLVGFVALLTDFGLRLLFFGGLGGGDDNDSGELGIIILVGSVIFLILAPIAAKLMQFAVSRRREALADVSGVYITRNPQGLISALEKLRQRPGIVRHAPAATAHMWFDSPLDKKSKGTHGWFNRLFETHPPLEQRIAALQEVAGTIPPPATA